MLETSYQYVSTLLISWVLDYSFAILNCSSNVIENGEIYLDKMNDLNPIYCIFKVTAFGIFKF